MYPVRKVFQFVQIFIKQLRVERWTEARARVSDSQDLVANSLNDNIDPDMLRSLSEV